MYRMKPTCKCGAGKNNRSQHALTCVSNRSFKPLQPLTKGRGILGELAISFKLGKLSGIGSWGSKTFP